jgi:uncharacterized protein
VDKPVAFLAVRLNEVEPDGTSKRITYNVLNLTHRASHEFPEALEPGRRYRIPVKLDDCAHVFKAGNRLRVAVSTTHWPLIWPSPEAVTLTLYTGASRLQLPVRPPRGADNELREYAPQFVPEPPVGQGSTVIAQAPPQHKTMELDVATGKLTITSGGGGGRSRINDTGTETSGAWREVLEIVDDDPNSAKVDFWRTQSYRRDEWDVRVETRLTMGVTKDEFLLVGDVKAYERDEEVFSKVWDRKIPRLLV